MVIYWDLMLIYWGFEWDFNGILMIVNDSLMESHPVLWDLMGLNLMVIHGLMIGVKCIQIYWILVTLYIFLQKFSLKRAYE